MFRNGFFESLSKVHFTVPLLIFVPVIVYFTWKAFVVTGIGAGAYLLWFLVGLAVWTVTEYLLHRFVFHLASDSPRMQRISYVLHGNHHEFPRDKQRLFMPPVPSIIIASIVFLLMYATMRTNVFAFFPGFILGYLLYGSMHYAIHAWNPPFKWMKPIWRNHHLHHYKNEQRGFGVSSHLWDLIFGTAFDLKKERENKEEVQKLMY